MRGTRAYTELELLKRATPRRHRARARAARACPTSGPGSPRATGDGPGAVHGPPGARQITLGEAAADVHDRRLPADAAPRRAPRPRAPGWTASAAGGDRGTTAIAVAEYWAVREARLDRRRRDARQARRLRAGRRRGPRADLSVPRRRHQARPLALRAAAQRARPRHGRRDDPARVGDAVRPVVHVRRRGQRRDVAARLDRHVGAPRPRHGPDDVARRDQRHGAARRGAAAPRSASAEPPRFLGHVHADVAGVPCHVMRLSFTGEAAWELHHPVDRSVELWRALMDVGRDLGIRPHGLQALFGLRLEKGHVIVGMDTELDTTPRRIGMDWAVRMDKPRFIGRAALERTAKLPDDRRWVGLHDGREARRPVEGTPIFDAEGEVIGNVTGSWHSPLLGTALMLGWQRRPPLADRVDHRRPRGGRHADARSTTRRATVPALEPLTRRARRRRPGRHRRVRRGPATPSTVVIRLGARTRRSCSASASVQRRRPARHRRGRGGLRRCLGRRGRSAAASRRMAAADRAPALAQGSIAGVPAKLPGSRRPSMCWSCGRAPPYVRRGCVDRADGERATSRTLLADPLGRRAQAGVRRRDHRRRRARPLDRVLPRDPPRHHQRRRPRGRLHRARATPGGTRRSSGPTTASPRRSASTSTARAVPGARGRDRRGDPPPDQGHRVAGPHRDGDAHRARPLRDEPGLRRRDRSCARRRSSRRSSRSST